MYRFKLRDVESYRERLALFLADRCLLFNPYLVSDEQLVDAAGRQKWRGPFSLTQMVILKFLRVESEGCACGTRERIIYTVGDTNQKFCERMETFTYPQTAGDSLRQVRHTFNGRKITHHRHVCNLVGKRVFVSRNIITCTPYGFGKVMSMHRLTGDVAKDARTMREAMIDARLEMLGRLLAYPEFQFYLDGTPSAPVDIQTPISNLMSQISSYRSLGGG